jgi:hypothetical protein
VQPGRAGEKFLYRIATMNLAIVKQNYQVAFYLSQEVVTDVNYFSRPATIIIPGSPLPSKPAPYPKRVKRREPVGRP